MVDNSPIKITIKEGFKVQIYRNEFLKNTPTILVKFIFKPPTPHRHFFSNKQPPPSLNLPTPIPHRIPSSTQTTKQLLLPELLNFEIRASSNLRSPEFQQIYFSDVARGMHASRHSKIKSHSKIA